MSTEDTVHTTFRSTSCSSSSRSTVERSMRISSSSKPFSRSCRASSTVPTAKRPTPLSRSRRARHTAPRPLPFPVSTPYRAAPWARSFKTDMLFRTAAFSMTSLRMADGSLLSVSGWGQMSRVRYFITPGGKRQRKGPPSTPDQNRISQRFTKNFQFLSRPRRAWIFQGAKAGRTCAKGEKMLQ